jgi:hypothetical protein
MAPASSLPRSQDLSTRPYPEPDRSSHDPSTFFYKIHLNVIQPFTTWFSSDVLPSDFLINNKYAVSYPQFELNALSLFGEEYKL